MWLLSTETATLRYFVSPEGVPGGFAILSHVWLSAAEEDTFQSVRDAERRCKENIERARFAKGSAEPLPNTNQMREMMLTLWTTQFPGVPPPLATSLLEESPLTDSDSAEHSKSPTKSKGSDKGSSTAESDVEPQSNGDRSRPHSNIPINPRDLVSPKVRSFLIFAEKHGYRWAWSDTCCIDKTSSAELTEAINSMFQYYSLSDICYAYLADVPSGTIGWEFEHSRWYSRGWTLQELVAPKTVVFMSQDWEPLGTKYELAETLQRITHVPASVLRFQRDVTEMSIAARMSWASERETTRVEDLAYCLFGLFGVNMPTLYGEGRSAFYRLQEEIMRTCVDTSLFAWGNRILDTVNLVTPNNDSSSMYESHLLAPSPGDFKYSEGVSFYPTRIASSKVSILLYPSRLLLTRVTHTGSCFFYSLA